MHTPEYDDAGRVVRVVVTRESEYDEDTYAEMAAWLRYKAMICGGCGSPLSLTTRPEVDWDISADEICRKCASRDIFMRQKDNDPRIERTDQQAEKTGRAKWSEGRLLSAYPVYPTQLPEVRRSSGG